MEIDELIERVNRVQWRERADITLEAKALIQCHVDLIRPIIRHIVSETGESVSEAHMNALTPGHDSPKYAEILGALFEHVTFTNAGVREPLILTFVANELWHTHSEWSEFPNPWHPLVELAFTGYPTSYEDNPEMSSVHLLVGLQNDIRRIPVVSAGDLSELPMPQEAQQPS